VIVKKKKDTFDGYTVELLWGDLAAIHRALKADHADPESDRIFASLSWYMDNVPKPGEDEEQASKADKAEKEAKDSGEEGRDTSKIGKEVPSKEVDRFLPPPSPRFKKSVLPRA